MQPGEIRERHRPVVGIDALEAFRRRRLALAELRVGRIVPQQRVDREHGGSIDPKAVDAAPHPEAEHVGHRLTHLRVAPVQVRLVLEEGVVVVLSGPRIEFPGAAAEAAQPVVGRAAIGRGIVPDIPVASGICSRRAALAEPGMLARGVVGYEVQDQLDAAGMQRRDQAIQVVERSESRIDACEVGDVVAEIGHGRGVDGREPDGADAEPGEIVQPRGNPRQIAQPIAVRVLKRQRIDLVDEGLLPPVEASVVIGRAVRVHTVLRSACNVSVRKR
jgi:hypothetical protein